MKKILLSLALALPLWLSAQVSNPESVTTLTSLDRTGWTATVSSNSAATGDDGGPAALLDNAPATFWHSKWEASEAPPYEIVIDMKAPKSFNGFMLQNRQSNANTNVKDIEIFTSLDGNTYTSQVVSTGLPQTTSPQYIDFPATVSAQFVKLVISNSYSGAYAALAELGTYTKIVTTDNTAWDRTGWTATTTSYQDGEGIEKILDNNNATFWHTNWGSDDEVTYGKKNPFDLAVPDANHRTSSAGSVNISIDMQTAKQINKISYVNRASYAYRSPQIFEIWTSTDGVAYNTLVGTYQQNNSAIANPTQISIPLGTTINTRYLQMKIIQVLSNGDPNTSMAEFRAHYDQVLPVELASFTAKANGASVNLNWTTATERNASHFNLTRSTDGVNFTTIARVEAAGNSSSVKNYRFVDATPLAGINYYQLQQVDANSDSYASKVASATVALSNSALLVKAVSASSVTLAVSGAINGTGTLTAVNAQGQVIASQSVNFNNSNTVTVNTGAAKGLIIFSLTTTNGSLTKKIIK